MYEAYLAALMRYSVLNCFGTSAALFPALISPPMTRERKLMHSVIWLLSICSAALLNAENLAAGLSSIGKHCCALLLNCSLS